MRSTFKTALDFVLRWEGGYADHPDDAGGRTFAGISEAAHPDVWSDDVVSQDEVQAVYRGSYWDRVQGDELPYPVDLAVMDYAVHSGPTRAVRELQKLVGVEADGIVGQQTVRNVGKFNPSILARALLGQRVLRLHRIADRRPSQAVFLKGWLRRVDNLWRHL